MTEMGKIIVIRHGNTDYNNTRVFQPHSAPLSTLGIQQAKNLGERLKSLKVVKVLTSDLARTKQTTELLLSRFTSPHGLEVVQSDLLREREFGDLKGTAFNDLQKDLFHPESDYQPANGESWGMFHDRVREAWNWVLSHAQEALKHPDDVVLVVTHGLFKTSLAAKIWNVKDKNVMFHNTSISTVTLKEPHEVINLNCIEHLDEETRSKL